MTGALVVRLMRAVGIASVVLMHAACAENPARPNRVDAPTLDGHPELISEAEIQAVLRMARHRLHSLLIFVRINRVHVASQNKVTVHFHLASVKQESWLEFSRVDGQWRITKEVFWDRDASRATHDG